jgi:hypothetical protein
MAKRLALSRTQLIDANNRNFFIPLSSIRAIVLRKRWHGCALIVPTDDQPAGRKFTWKPALNDFSRIHELCQRVFGELVRIE